MQSSAVVKFLNSETSKKVWKTGLSVAIYVLVGGIVYTSQEPDWSTIDSVYFSIVTMSTVGYGDFSPTTPELKAFTIFMIYLGIVLVFSRVADLINYFATPLTDAGRAYLEVKFPPVGVDLDNSGDVDYEKPRHPVIYYAKNLLPSFILEWCAAPVSPSTPARAPSSLTLTLDGPSRAIAYVSADGAALTRSCVRALVRRQEFPVHLRRHLHGA